MSKESDVTYGGRGPTVLGITWSETGLATILILLRTKNASIRPPRPNSVIGFSGIYRLRWDFVWVIVAYVRDGEHLSILSCIQSYQVSLTWMTF